MNQHVRCALIASFLVTATWVFGAEAAKTDPAVRTALSESPEATVIIVLRTQLDAPMVRDTRAMYEPSIQSALSQLQAVSNTLVVDERGVEFAQAMADRHEMAARQAIARSIDAVCKPEQDAFVARLSSLGGKVIRTYRAVNAVAARIPASALTALELDDAVRQIALDGVLRGNLDVSTAAVGAPLFWNAGLTGAGQSIALIDSGVDVSHPAFVGAKIINGPVFSAAWPASVPADNKNSPDDFTSMGHGTQMAGIIVGQGSPGFTRHYGMARGATLYNLKAAYNGLNAFDGGNHGGPNESYMPQADMLAALDYAVLQTPATIVNVSYSAGGGSGMQGYNGATISLMEDIIATHNIAVVTSAAVAPGFGSGSPVAPATVRNAIAVGAMDDHNTTSRADDTLAPTNATGPTNAGARKPDLTAPGVNVLAPTGQWEGAQPDYAVMNEFFESRSPSAAAAHVSGALALLRQIGITDMLMAKAVLINSAEANGWTPNGGWGYLDLWNAKLRGSNLLSTRRYERLSPISFDVAGPVNSGAINITLAHEGPGAALFIFDRWTGQRVYYGGATVDKVSLPNGNYLIQVYNGQNGGHFVLALSKQGFEQVTIARVGAEFTLNYDCYGASAVALGSKFSITCTVTNPGDIEAHQVSGRAFLRFPDSESGTACTIDFGSVPGHGTRSLSCLALATRPGPQSVCVDFVQRNKYYDPEPEYGGTSTMECYNTTVTGGGITGKVTVSRVPVEGVFVTLTGPVQRSNKTNVNGEFALYDLLPGAGPYTVTPTKAGYTFNPPFAVVATLPSNQVPNLSFVASGNIPPGNTIANGN